MYAEFNNTARNEIILARHNIEAAEDSLLKDADMKVEAEGDPEGISTAAHLADALRALQATTFAVDIALANVVGMARDRGMSWQTISDELLITRQAAMKRYAARLQKSAKP